MLMTGAEFSDRLADSDVPMAAEIVDHDDIAWQQRWNQNLGDINQECLTIDRAINQPWRLDPVVPQHPQKSHRLPVAVGDFGH